MHQSKQELLGRLAVFHGAGKHLELTSQVVPSLQTGEVLVRNLYTTLCGSDLHTYCGLRTETCPTVLGHEIVGQIIEIDTSHLGFDLRGKPLRIGDIITWSIFSSNPLSPNSIAGIPQKGDGLFKYGHALVSEQDAFHGGLAQYCVLKANTEILRIPNDMPLSVAATINCSVSTVAGALRLAGEIKDKSILITGMGHLGITCAAMCKEAGAEWVGAADIASERLDDALRFGADQLFNLNGDNHALIQQMKANERAGVDVVFDMSGSPDAMEFGVDVLAIGGAAIWVGAVFNTRPLNLNAEKIIRNLTTIKGLHNYNYTDFKYALDFMKRNWNRYPFEKIVEQEFPLEQADEAFKYAVQHKPLRVGIRL